METLIERGCGLDVHKKTVAACVRVPGSKETREQHVRTFGTMAAELVALREWLKTHGVTHVAMESTGVYWKPVWYVLEEAFTCLLVNAAHVKQVPGRKTDVLDCAWIAQLHHAAPRPQESRRGRSAQHPGGRVPSDESADHIPGVGRGLLRSPPCGAGHAPGDPSAGATGLPRAARPGGLTREVSPRGFSEQSADSPTADSREPA
jgi:Transposase